MPGKFPSQASLTLPIIPYEAAIAGEGKSVDVPVVEILIELCAPQEAELNDGASDNQNRALPEYLNARGLRRLLLLLRFGLEAERQTSKRRQRVSKKKKDMIPLGRVSGKDAPTRGDAIARLLTDTMGVARDYL